MLKLGKFAYLWLMHLLFVPLDVLLKLVEGIENFVRYRPKWRNL